MWCSMAQTPRLFFNFLLFPSKCFPGSSGHSECSFFKHVWKYLPKVLFFYSNSVDFHKYIFIVEKQQFSTKVSFGHVGWNFHRHAIIFHNSNFVGPKSKNKKNFDSKKYNFSTKISFAGLQCNFVNSTVKLLLKVQDSSVRIKKYSTSFFLKN